MITWNQSLISILIVYQNYTVYLNDIRMLTGAPLFLSALARGT